MSQLKVNSIVPAGGLPSGANGGIIQVVSTTKTDAFSTTSSSFTDITGFSATITPSSNSNKILVIVTLNGFGTASDSSDFGGMMVLVRGSTQIAIGDAAGSRSRASIGLPSRSGAQGLLQQSGSISHLDSPATTSATTYKVQARHTQGSEVRLNMNIHDSSDNANRVRSASCITLLEVST